MKRIKKGIVLGFGLWLLSTAVVAQDIRLRTIQEFKSPDQIRNVSLLIQFTKDQRVIINNYNGKNLVYDIIVNNPAIERSNGDLGLIFGVLDSKGEYYTIMMNYEFGSNPTNLFWIEKDGEEILSFTFKQLD
jgi:hypothetical protein